MKRLHMTVGLLMLAPWATTMALEAPCCASGGNGRPSAVTAPSSSELGKVSPGGQNLSLSPEYQVYQFTRSGVRYIEVTDLSGVPRAAFASVGGALLSLPIGEDAVQQIAVVPAWTDVVYEDVAVTVARYVAADGTVTWQVYVK